LSWAAHIWTKIPHVSRHADYAIVPLTKHPNFGPEKPAEGDLLVYRSTPNQWVGHVAVVVGVLERNGQWYVRVAEQNQRNNKMWPGDYADELVLETKNSDEKGAVVYGITHPDPDLELDGWVRAMLDDAVLRAPWFRPEPTLAVNGIYDQETTIELQKFVGSFPDGSHGGMTNTDIRNVLRQYGQPDEGPTTPDYQELLNCLRRFLLRHYKVMVPGGEHLDLTKCTRQGACVCCVILREDTGESEGQEAAAPCDTTKALQIFLNNIKHPHDLRSAMQQFNQSS
jgi:hypothetical protein